MILNVLSKMKKNTFWALRSYILTVLSMPAQITRSDVSLKVTAVIWYLHFKSSIGPLFSSLIFNSFWNSYFWLYRIYFITSITFDNKPSIELNFWSGYLDISRYFDKSGLLFGKKYDIFRHFPSSTIPYLDSSIVWCRTNKWITSSCSVNSINNTVMAFHSLQSCSCSIVEHSDSVIRWGCEYMFAFLTKLEIQNGTLKFEFKVSFFLTDYFFCQRFLRTEPRYRQTDFCIAFLITSCL